MIVCLNASSTKDSLIPIKPNCPKESKLHRHPNIVNHPIMNLLVDAIPSTNDKTKEV